MLDTVNELLRTTRSQYVLSCRHTFFDSINGRWPGGLALRLRPFEEHELMAFVGAWFQHEPTSCNELLEWLLTNNAMKAAARSPLIAALLCSLFAAGADLPATEGELYASRLDLLLGRWEQAKGIPKLPRHVRRACHMFLVQLAAAVHQSQKRACTTAKATGIANTYCDRTYYRKAEALVEDCVHRGLLEYDSAGRLYLGHLTYQEHLTAEWMVSFCTPGSVWEYAHDPWWRKPIEFYCEMKADITELVGYGLDQFSLAKRMGSKHLDKWCAQGATVVQAARIARYTNPTQLGRLNRLVSAHLPGGGE
jgi:hypothetical protein